MNSLCSRDVLSPHDVTALFAESYFEASERELAFLLAFNLKARTALTNEFKLSIVLMSIEENACRYRYFGRKER